jgi:Leucine-rich repeat (LRR) protein
MVFTLKIIIYLKNNSLIHVYLNNNNLQSIDKDTFSGLFHLNKIVLSNNQLQFINENTFQELTSLREIALNSNLIKTLNKYTFNGLLNLKKLNISFNQITDIDKSIFIGLVCLEEISLNDNQLKFLPNAVFRDNKALLEINLSNNDISKIQINDLSNLNKEATVNLKNNIEIYNFPFIFNSMFHFIKKDKATNEMKNYFCDLSFYLNEAVYKTEVLFEETRESFAYNLNQVKSYKCTLLDFLLSYRMIDESFIIHFKGYVENLLKENKLSHNIEFKLKSSHTIEVICERNDLTLFETFFEIEIENSDQHSENQWLIKPKEYYLGINFVKCFQTILNNNNEPLSILLFKLLAYVTKKV